jgi:hypothetical protein
MSKVLLDIDQNMINAAVKAEVGLAIAKSLGGTENVVASMIQNILTQKVNNEGNISGYSYENKYDWVDVQVRKQITEIGRELVSEFMNDNRAKLKAELEKQIKGKMAKELAGAMLKAMDSSLNCKWNHKIEMTVKGE